MSFVFDVFGNEILILNLAFEEKAFSSSTFHADYEKLLFF